MNPPYVNRKKMQIIYFSSVGSDVCVVHGSYLEQATIINGTDQNASFACPMIQPLLSDYAI